MGHEVKVDTMLLWSLLTCFWSRILRFEISVKMGLSKVFVGL